MAGFIPRSFLSRWTLFEHALIWPSLYMTPLKFPVQSDRPYCSVPLLLLQSVYWFGLQWWYVWSQQSIPSDLFLFSQNPSHPSSPTRRVGRKSWQSAPVVKCLPWCELSVQPILDAVTPLGHTTTFQGPPLHPHTEPLLLYTEKNHKYL